MPICGAPKPNGGLCRIRVKKGRCRFHQKDLSAKVLVICATEESIRHMERGNPRPHIEYIKTIYSDLEFYYSNVQDLDEKRPNVKITDFFGKEEPASFGVRFDVIILEHCPKSVFTTLGFKRFRRMLRKGGLIIMDSFSSILPEILERLKNIRTILQTHLDTPQTFKVVMEGLDDPDAELKAYLQANPVCKKISEIKSNRDLILDYALDVVAMDLEEPPHLLMLDRKYVYDIDHLNSILKNLKMTAKEAQDLLIITSL